MAVNYRSWNFHYQRPSSEGITLGLAQFFDCLEQQLHLEAFQEQCGQLLVIPFSYRLRGRLKESGVIELALDRRECERGPAEYYLVADCRLVGNYDYHRAKPRPFGQLFVTNGGDHDGTLDRLRSRGPFFVDHAPNKVDREHWELLRAGVSRLADRTNQTAERLANNGPRPCTNMACKEMENEHKEQRRRILELEATLIKKDRCIDRIKGRATPELWEQLTSVSGKKAARRPSDRSHGHARIPTTQGR